MRVLFLSSTWPCPPNNGLKMRTWALLRALFANGHTIAFLGVQDSDGGPADYATMQEICEQAVAVPADAVVSSSSRAQISRLESLFGRKPHSVVATRSKPVALRIRELLSRGDIDAIFCEQSQPLVNLPATITVPVILDNHNAEHRIWRQFLGHAPGFLSRSYARIESRKLRAWERLSCHRATIALTCSDQDRTILQSLSPRTPFFVVPNALDTDRYIPSVAEEPLKLIFQGGMDWYPNRDAVAHFVDSILPRLRKLAPGVQFVVAGRNPSEEFRRRFAAGRDVQFTGTLPDMRPEIASAAVCVVPLRIGSGTRLKILEAAAMGKAIVSTRLGAEGLEFRQNQEIVLADDPADFAREVAALLADPSRRKWLGSHARKRVQERYSFPILRKALASAMATIPAARPAHCSTLRAAVPEARSSAMSSPG